MNYAHEIIIKENCPFNECHAVSIIHLKNNDLLAVWFAGTKEGNTDVAIWMSRRSESGWSPPQIIAKVLDEPHWNPVLFRRSDGEIHLYFKTGQSISGWVTWITRSRDEGMSWTVLELLVKNDNSGGRGPVKNKPIILSNGTIAAPASVERDCWQAFVDLSYDGGITWEPSQIVPVEDIILEDEHSGNKLGVIQPTLWESTPGNIHMLLRSNNGFIYRSDSNDFGKSWSKAYPTNLPNNNSGIDMTKFTDGTLALAYNPVNHNWGTRKKLCLAFSHDNGISWRDKRIINHEQEDKNGDVSNEFSYPAVINVEDNLIIAYTLHRKNIAVLSGSREDIMNNLAKDD